MKLTILPDKIITEVQTGESLLSVIRNSGIHLATSCGGIGTCGKCSVYINSGHVKAGDKVVTQQEVLACQAHAIEEDIIINIPHDERRLSEHKVLINEVDLENPFPLKVTVKAVTLELPQATLENNVDDTSRFLLELKKHINAEEIFLSLEAMKDLPIALRKGNWKVNACVQAIGKEAFEVMSIEPATTLLPFYGLAIDIGTTTVKLNLVDLNTGQVVSSGGEYNLQQQFGDDVITRIIYSEEDVAGLIQLQKAVLDSINRLIKEMLDKESIDSNRIKQAVVAGNTTMIHLFLGIPASNIRLEPYIPAVNAPFPVRAGDLGLLMSKVGYVYCLPAVGSYVGGDITAGVLSTGMFRNEDLTLLIDIGTNGEMVLGNSDWLISCACSAGPCFEGGGIQFGMRAMDGAIDEVSIEANGDVNVSTINETKPVGICGSGLITVISQLLEHNYIERTGQINRNLNSSRIREGEEGLEIVLVWGSETAHGRDIVLLESDLQNLTRAKAAIYAGLRVLMKEMGIRFDEVSEILIAGGFGNSLNIRDAIKIGMLPDIPIEKYRYVGNSALKGAQMALCSSDALDKVMEVAKGMTYLDLSLGNDFMDEFMSAMFLPHTDYSQFPTV